MSDLEGNAPGGAPLKLTERVAFGFHAPLGQDEALAFVRDVSRSLADGDLLEGLAVTEGDPTMVSATLPVATPLFGRRELPFRSALESTPNGARLLPATAAAEGRGWAEVGGEATVAPSQGAPEGPAASRIDYVLDIAIFLDLPAADRWGTRALTKMIELTAGAVLQRLVERLPPAVERAAANAERLLADAEAREDGAQGLFGDVRAARHGGEGS